MRIECKSKVSEFLSVAQTVSNICNESMITFTPNGVLLRVVDPTNAMLVNLKIEKEFFDVYEVTEEANFNIDFAILYKIVKSMKKGFIMEDKESELVFTDDKGKLQRSIMKIVADREEKAPLSFEYVNSYSFDFEHFYNMIALSNDVDMLTEFIGTNNLVIKTKGNIEKIEVKLDTVNPDLEEQTNFFSTNYIVKLKPMIDIFDAVTVYLKTSVPLKIVGEDKGVSMNLFIAPRMV